MVCPTDMVAYFFIIVKLIHYFLHFCHAFLLSPFEFLCETDCKYKGNKST